MQLTGGQPAAVVVPAPLLCLVTVVALRHMLGVVQAQVIVLWGGGGVLCLGHIDRQGNAWCWALGVFLARVGMMVQLQCWGFHCESVFGVLLGHVYMCISPRQHAAGSFTSMARCTWVTWARGCCVS